MSTFDHRVQTQQAYDVVALSYARMLPGLDAETQLDIAVLGNFAERCLKDALGPVADAGCGTGRVSAHLAAHGLHVIGVDLSPGMVEAARRVHADLDFQVGALEDLPFRDASLGGLLAWYSLIHTAPDRLSVIAAQFERVLKRDAWLLTAFQCGAGERVDRTSAYGHAVSMTNDRHRPEHVRDALIRAGFEIHVHVLRAPEGAETTPQCLLLARKATAHHGSNAQPRQ